MKASVYDVAKKARVSVVTVSRVINNVPTVRQTSREKVQRAIEELDYQPNAAARSLARGKTDTIGLIIPTLTDPFIMQVVGEVDRALEKQGYFLALTVIDKHEDDSKKRSNFLFQQERVDGILIMTPQFEKDYVASLKSKQIPFVILDNQAYPFVDPSIVVDNFKGGYEVARHLIELGHSEIAYIGGPVEFLSASQRGKGFQSALSEVGIEVFCMERGEYDISTGYDVMNDWLKKGQIPTAIFADDDHIAFGVVDALRLARISVPEDVSVVGFDNHPFGAKLHPLLTTVKQPAVQMGAKGVETLLKIMKGGSRDGIVIKMQPELIIRESTTFPKKQ